MYYPQLLFPMCSPKQPKILVPGDGNFFVLLCRITIFMGKKNLILYKNGDTSLNKTISQNKTISHMVQIIWYMVEDCLYIGLHSESLRIVS